MYTAGLDHIDRIIWFANLKQIVIRIDSFGLNIFAHFEYDFEIKIAKNPLYF